MKLAAKAEEPKRRADDACRGGHLAIVVEFSGNGGGKSYRKWCCRCMKVVAQDSKTALLRSN